MDPFLLSGPAFLLFYLVLGALVYAGLRTLYAMMESGDEPKLPALTDPYLIASLRGGWKEALRVGIFSLADRGLLAVSDKSLATKRPRSTDLVKRPIEKAILARYIKAGAASAIFDDSGARSASDAYRETLARYGLVADGSAYGKRVLPALVALAILVGVAMVKINIALAQGRHNIWFLVILAAALSIAVLFAFVKSRTTRGSAVLADLERLFGRLKNRSHTLEAGGRTNEAALLAGIFGIAALSESAFPFLATLYPRRDTSGGSSGCGSGTSSSGCGGGGGGGGGCGGCGGS